MKLLCAILFVTLSFTSYSQNNGFFWPDGRPFITLEKNVKSRLDSLKMICSHNQTYKGTIVFYYPLSDKPAFIWTDNKQEIPLALKSYKRSKYLDSYDFKSNVKELYASGTLDSAYATWALGIPDKKINKGDTILWTYKSSNLVLYFLHDQLVSYLIFPFGAIEKAGYYISSYSYTVGDYSTGFSISIRNASKKKVKYVWITIDAFNPVEDLIATKTVKCIGPVEANDLGNWDFEDVFFSKVIDYILIKEIKILYWDGTIKLSPKSEIRKLRMDLQSL